MRNEALRWPGVRTYTSGSPPISLTELSGTSASHVVVASPVNKRGDFISPNAFMFDIQTSKISRSSYYRRQRGYPPQIWDGNSSNTNGGYSVESTTFPFPYQPLDGVVALRDRALAKIYDQLRGNSNLAVDIAEGASTIHMLRKALNVQRGFVSIVNLIVDPTSPSKAPKKRNTRTVNGTVYHKRTGRQVLKKSPPGTSMGQRRLDYVTGLWLEARYGWIPLASSLYDAYDNLMRSQSTEVKTFVARSGNFKEIHPTIWSKGSGVKNHPVRLGETLKERIRLVYEFTIPDKGIWDWTSLNPAAIAWELLPLSFVADWFFTIGKSLENLENYWLWKSSFHGGYETYTYEIVQTRSCLHEWAYDGPAYMGDLDREAVAFDWFKRKIYKDRKLVTSLPFPGRPRFNVRLGSKQMLDLAALLHQFIGKKFR